ncbi:hypothetical protein F5884DRAFT_794654 [Xylogone sp. PMI_703]|nr:hypothetical protein F5884DRAFT_794654 [Xylogone sp. PMI_703]
MSYAAAAAKGPKQSDEEKRAPPMPELERHESPSSSSLIDVESSPSVHTITSEQERSEGDLRSRAREEAQKARDKFEDKERAAKGKAKKAKEIIEANSDNPVVIANAIAVLALGGALGFGAFRKYEAGELSVKLVAAWTGVVGAVALGDYFLSRYLFNTKYPPKK